MGFVLEDINFIVDNRGGKSKRYRLYCDSCDADRGYGMKSRANMLCKACSHKGKDYLKDKRGLEYSLKMSLAKTGQIPWCKGKTGIFTLGTIEKMRNARISKNITGTMVGMNQRRIKRRCLVYLGRAIKRYSSGSTSSFPGCEQLFDFTFQEFVNYFESKFKDGMNWNNHGSWHIDHIVPDSAFQYNDIASVDFKKSWSKNNLQPLWAKDNLIKGNR